MVSLNQMPPLAYCNLYLMCSHLQRFIILPAGPVHEVHCLGANLKRMKSDVAVANQGVLLSRSNRVQCLD